MAAINMNIAKRSFVRVREKQSTESMSAQAKRHGATLWEALPVCSLGESLSGSSGKEIPERLLQMAGDTKTNTSSTATGEAYS